jgi:IPT/TIG domain
MRGKRASSWVRVVVALGAALMAVVAATSPANPATAIGAAPAQVVAAPTVTGASPLSGPVAGGTVVTMTGMGFQSGVTAVMVVLTGGGWQREIPASAMTINADGTTMSFAMPEGPAGGGKAGLVAFVPGKQAQFVPTFTYAELAVTGASPTSGPVAGGTVVTMTGMGFQSGVTAVMVVLTGGGWQREIPASAMTINADGTTMSFAMPEGPVGGGVAGLVAFVPGKQGRIVPTFTYLPPPPPTVSGATPMSGPVAGGTLVTMTGTGFERGGTQVLVVLTGGSWQVTVPASAVLVNGDGTALAFVTPEGPPGGGLVGLIAFTSAGRAEFVPSFTYAPSAAPRERVADASDLATTGTGTTVLLVVGAGAVATGLVMLAIARRRPAGDGG